jgi:hypothetical protein
MAQRKRARTIRGRLWGRQYTAPSRLPMIPMMAVDEPMEMGCRGSSEGSRKMFR